MCTGRVDLAFVVHAFLKGADGVIIGGCWPGECHYVTEGNYDALGNLHLGRKLLGLMGVTPERLRLEWIAASEGSRFAEVMNDFAAKIGDLGPIGSGEGIEPEVLTRRLKAVDSIIPYLKLVEREKLRVSTKTTEAYESFYASDEVNSLFIDLVADKLVVSQILSLLGERPLSTGEISTTLGLSPSDVSKHMKVSSRQGLVRYDLESKCFTLP
jgi:F420-non-reducing hydrogenase iron-sulfur subunit